MANTLHEFRTEFLKSNKEMADISIFGDIQEDK